jgi:hypothetical protein
MSTGQADRTVMFRLAVATDPAAAAELRRFGADIARAQEQAARGTADAARKLAQETERARGSGTGVRPPSAGPPTEDSAARSRATNPRALRAEQERLAAEDEKSARRQAAAAEKLARQQAAAAEHAAQMTERLAERKAAAEERFAQRAAMAAERAAERAQAAQNRRTVDILRQQEREAVEAERAADRKARAEEQAVRQSVRAEHAQERESFRERRGFIMGAHRTFRGLTDIGMGLAYGGLSSEEDTQKLLQGIMRIREAAGLLVGTVELIHGVTQAMTVVKAASAAGAVGETALAAARARTTEATAAATAAELARGGSGAAAGAAGGAAAGAGGLSIGGGLTALGATLTSLPVLIGGAVASSLAAVLVATNIGGSRDRLAGWMGERPWNPEVGRQTRIRQEMPWWFRAGKWTAEQGLNAGDRMLNPLGHRDIELPSGVWGEQARGNVALQDQQRLATERQEARERGWETRGIEWEGQHRRAEIERRGRQLALDAQYRAAGFRQDRPPEIAEARGQVESSTSQATRQRERLADLEQKSQVAPVEGQRLEEERHQVTFAIAQQRQAEEREREERQQGELAVARAQDQEQTAYREAQAARQKAAAAQAEVDRFRPEALQSGAGPGRAEELGAKEREAQQAAQEAVELAHREEEAAEHRLDIEKQIGQQKIQAAQESEQAARKELDARLAAIDAERKHLDSAREHFGALNPAEQRLAADLLKRARQPGQVQNLREEELKRIEQIGSEEAQRIAGEERKRRGQAAAQRFGIADTFGAEEGRIRRDQQAATAAETKIKTQHEVRVKLEAHLDEVARQVHDSAFEEFQKLRPIMDAMVRDAVNRAMEESLRTRNRAQQQLAK